MVVCFFATSKLSYECKKLYLHRGRFADAFFVFRFLLFLTVKVSCFIHKNRISLISDLN